MKSRISPIVCLAVIIAAFLIAGYMDFNDEILTHGAVMMAGK